MKQNTLRRLISLGLVLLLILAFSLLSPYFFTLDNLLEIFRDASVVGIVGVGLTYVIITAGIDLSTGSAMALAGMLMANIYKYTVLPIWLMVLAALILGILTGIFNGWVIARIHVPEFIATLATMGIYRALTYIIAIRDAGGVMTSQPMTYSSFVRLGQGIGPIHFVSIAFVIIVIAGQVLLKYTRFGIRLYAIGSNRKSAVLSGIPVAPTLIGAYAIVGLCSAVGAVFTTARLQSTTALLGSGFEFNPIAAAVVGGVALSGGAGDVIGTCIGAFFMAVLENGILKLHMNTAYQYVIKGIIIILVVIFDACYKSRFERKKAAGAAKVVSENA